MKQKDIQNVCDSLAAAAKAQAAKIATLQAQKRLGKATQAQLQDAIDLGMQIEFAQTAYAYLLAHADQLA